jgi:hypothetical protein
LNVDKKTKGYFGKNGRVKTQKLRGELSNGFVNNLESLLWLDPKQIIDLNELKKGMEFNSVNGIEICRKYISVTDISFGSKTRKKKQYEISGMFKRHWDTKQFMREYQNIPPGIIYIEEKIHGTSGRTGYVEVTGYRKWYQIWKPKSWKEWRVVSGTRRMDHIDGHISETRKQIHEKLAPNLHQGETVYYEIFGHDVTGKEIQPGFSYGCVGGEYKVLLYRVTITTPDGFSVDIPREAVYKRAEELGLMAPIQLDKLFFGDKDDPTFIDKYIHGNSAIANHIKEGVVIWHQESNGNWNCLKHKSAEFLLLESKQLDENKGDVENVL